LNKIEKQAFNIWIVEINKFVKESKTSHYAEDA
jgi:hypothetical protein